MALLKAIRVFGRALGPLLLSIQLLAASFVARAAETAAAKSSAVSLTNFTPNLPILFLQVTQQIISERKVPCSVDLVMPPGSGAKSTGAITGVVRVHGAS